jgi:hypothetical protein
MIAPTVASSAWKARHWSTTAGSAIATIGSAAAATSPAASGSQSS